MTSTVPVNSEFPRYVNHSKEDDNILFRREGGYFYFLYKMITSFLGGRGDTFTFYINQYI